MSGSPRCLTRSKMQPNQARFRYDSQMMFKRKELTHAETINCGSREGHTCQ